MVEYPPNIKTPKAKAVYLFFKGLYIFETGKGKTFGRFLGWMGEVTMIMVGLKYFGVYNPQPFDLVIAGIVAVILCCILGYFYMRYNVDLIESLVSQERQPMIRDIYKKFIDKKGGVL